MDDDAASRPSPEDTAALLTLVLAGGRGQPRRTLLERHAGPADALAAGPTAWKAAGCSVEQCNALATPDRSDLQHSLDWLELPQHHLIGWHSHDYPPLLRQSPTPPLALFIDGDPAQLWHPSIAVVGSRSPSAGGRENAADFAAAFARAGFSIASGLATGVDAAAHQTALALSARTFAVVGTGPDLTYPRHHLQLHQRIAKTGAVVSEYPPGTTARPGHFPARNRILAGISLGTVVIEAAERSGALITARLAAEAGREVFALPGSLHNPMARGCHRLIRDGVQLATRPEDVLEGLANIAQELALALRIRLDAPTHVGRPVPPPAFDPPDPDYQRLWKALGYDPTGMDSLIERTGLTAATLSSMLLVMELDGRVVAEHGRYVRAHGFLHLHSV
ncbi:MAG: DNA-processing protein DprA [Stenotrophomonas sp.]